MAVGNVDAHVTPPAAQAIEPGRCSAMMGTSTCHVMNGDALAEVPGMCGVVEDGITSGCWAMRPGRARSATSSAGSSSRGCRARYHDARARPGSLHELPLRGSAEQPVGAHGLVALDWMGGNRSTLVDHTLSGVIVGLTLATRPPEIYRALLESTAYGTREIIENFERSGRTGDRPGRRRRPAQEPAADADLRGRAAGGR